MLRWRHRPSKGVCGDAGEGRVIKSDGAGADDGDGGREAVIVLCVADVVKVCALVGLPVVDEYVGDIVAEDYDMMLTGRKLVSMERISWRSGVA